MAIKTDDQIAAELARVESKRRELEQERERRASESARDLADRQAEWRRDVIANADAFERRLEAEATAYFKAAETAMLDGDIVKAWQEWCAYNRSHRTRARVRIEAQSAAQALGVDPHVRSDLNTDRGSFVDFLNSHEGQFIDRGVQHEVDTYVGELPTE